VAEPPSQPPVSPSSPPEVLLAAARKALEEKKTDAMKELAEEIDDVLRRYLAERG
jgi:hypothetical protein